MCLRCLHIFFSLCLYQSERLRRRFRKKNPPEISRHYTHKYKIKALAYCRHLNVLCSLHFWKKLKFEHWTLNKEDRSACVLGFLCIMHIWFSIFGGFFDNSPSEHVVHFRGHFHPKNYQFICTFHLRHLDDDERGREKLVYKCVKCILILKSKTTTIRFEFIDICFRAAGRKCKDRISCFRALTCNWMHISQSNSHLFICKLLNINQAQRALDIDFNQTLSEWKLIVFDLVCFSFQLASFARLVLRSSLSLAHFSSSF